MTDSKIGYRELDSMKDDILAVLRVRRWLTQMSSGYKGEAGGDDILLAVEGGLGYVLEAAIASLAADNKKMREIANLDPVLAGILRDCLHEVDRKG